MLKTTKIHLHITVNVSQLYLLCELFHIIIMNNSVKFIMNFFADSNEAKFSKYILTVMSDVTFHPSTRVHKCRHLILIIWCHLQVVSCNVYFCDSRSNFEFAE